MKVEQLIKKLQQVNSNKRVYIVDGHTGYIYYGEFEVKESEDFVDIGVGGCLVEDE
jgi:hypothetical protein